MAVVVKVKDSHRWARVRVSGHEFTKAGEVMAEGLVDDEMRQSDLLQIEPVEASDPVPATSAAEELAVEEGIDLHQVAGSGEDGRVLVRDVREAVDEREG